MSINGWLDKDEADALREYACKVEGNIVEIGSYQGKSTVVLASSGNTVYAIDNWEDYFGVSGEESYQNFLKNVAGLSVIPHRVRVEDWTPIPAEMCFLDGDHSYEGTLAQIQKAKACNPKYILAHDVSNEEYAQGVRDACEKELGAWSSKINRIGIWVLR